MPINVADIRANLNENIRHAVNVIGKSRARKAVFEAIYRGKGKIKSVDEIADVTKLNRVRVLQEGGRLVANQIVEQTKKDGQTAYRKDDTYSHYKGRILSIVSNPSKAKKYPTKQEPKTSATTYKIVVPGAQAKVRNITVDDVDSFALVRKIRAVDPSLRVDRIAESRINAGIRKILGEKSTFKDWGGEANDIYTNKLKLKGRRRTAAFAIKGKATSGKLTPKKMGKNGDQIARLAGSTADVILVVYHGEIDQSVTTQLYAFALARAISGNTIYYGVIDGVDLNRLYQAYRNRF